MECTTTGTCTTVTMGSWCLWAKILSIEPSHHALYWYTLMLSMSIIHRKRYRENVKGPGGYIVPKVLTLHTQQSHMGTGSCCCCSTSIPILSLWLVKSVENGPKAWHLHSKEPPGSWLLNSCYCRPWVSEPAHWRYFLPIWLFFPSNLTFNNNK